MAYNADEARDILASSAIDIMICDIEMPGESGLELIQWMQDAYPEIICIILTGFPDFNYARSAISLGVYQYLLKPVSFEELEKVISSAIERVEENMAVSAKTPNEKDSEMSDPIRQVRGYLEEHYNEIITRRNIESLVHLNGDYINREFKKMHRLYFNGIHTEVQNYHGEETAAGNKSFYGGDQRPDRL